MLLSDAFEKLSFGPLSNLAIGGSGSGVIPESRQPSVVVRINHALTALYTRFPLVKKTIILETQAGRFQYPLRRDFALTSTSTEPFKFIIDDPSDPFLGDVAKLEGVSSHENYELPFNDRNDERSWHKAAFDVLSVGFPRDGERFFAHYRARHAQISVKDASPETEIVIPSELEQAFLHHVAGNIYAGIGQEDSMMKAQMHMTVFESECMLHEEQNTFDQWSGPDGIPGDMFRERGWV